MNDSNLDPQAEPTTAQLEAEVIEQGRAALSLAPAKQLLVASSQQALTAQQARVQEVTDALAPAYAKASTLELSDEEIAALQAVFPDDAVEIRPHDGLIYIPHIHISNRLNRVLKPGQWATVCRRHWLDGTVMYGEYVLVVRGCYVGESIGGHPYVANNPKTNFSDALESTRAEALRRICGKTLGVGSQVWDPGYSRDWVARYAFQQHGKWGKKSTPGADQPPPPAAPRQSSTSTPRRTAAESDPNTAADAANASRTRRTSAPHSRPLSASRAAPAPPPAAAPGHSCPKCRGTATKDSEEWEGIRWCQRCGWQWDMETGAYYEGHDWAKVICTRPPKGVKLDEYRKAPQTLGQISRIDNKRWYGLVMNNTEAESAKGWTSPAGKHYPATAAEIAFARACEDAVDYLESQQEGREQKVKDEADPGDDIPF